MKKLTSAELRTAFLEFFHQRGHSIEPSSSLVPVNDPTLLFTNAGMVQFKDVFLGREQRDFNKAVTSQRCVRAGGKHNDLENVGYTARHHTFFEMLGNFSFGDYFKKDAIHYAWDFLTKELEIPAEKLWITVFEEDAEAESIWLHDVGISPTRFSKIGAKDNFWSMGDIGPCGPCTEIFYDHGAGIPGGPPGTPEEEGDRYIEVWNLVFMQYDRAADGTLTPLPKPSVDTGMGLERISAVLQGVHSNYEIDLFQKLLTAAAELAGTTDLTQSSLRVIADHIRSCAFLVADGVMPSNEGRGYVLRRIIRRAIRHGYRLGIHDVFFYKLVAPLVEEMGDAFPELKAAQTQVERLLKKEEERFAETLGQGMKILEACVARMQGSVIPGETVFQLYDTYGFPVDLTADFARENNLTVDHAGFEMAMSAQRNRARSASSFGADYNQDIKLDSQTEFTGYNRLDDQVHIVALYQQGQPVASLQAGEEGLVVLDKTPFYAESGGQVGDCGRIVASGAVFEVTDTQKQGGNLFLHKGKLISGTLTNGQLCEARVSTADRKATELNHTATHLLHAALRQTLGDHVTQKGSLVNAERLRFDFSHFEPLTAEQINVLERMVNEQIRLNNPVTAQIMAKDDAVNAGAMALFGEKYGAEVRVLKIGEFSTELCGGTHVERAGDIGCFKIISETGVAAGVRRIEAVTGSGCIDWIAIRDKALTSIAGLLKSPPEKAAEKVEQLLEKTRSLEKQLERLNSKLASSAGDELSAQAVDVAGVKVLAVKLNDVDPKSLRDMADQLKNKLGSCAIVLAIVEGDKVSLIAGVSKDKMGQIKAGDLVNFVATQVGGKGGGKPDLAQAGGNDPSGLAAALAKVPVWIQAQLGA
ncbi:MAG: alanine--tRNA ligase [Methylococcaceae bacterium]|nr:alanine--tRNA ligase [Methylococcaceae bacterium]